MRIVFMGSPEFAVPALEALVAEGHDVVRVVTQPDKPAGRGRRMLAPPVKAAAEAAGLAVAQPRSARTGELQAILEQSGAELAVVVAYGKILPAAVLEAVPRGCINIHASILPRYRGAAPIQRAIMAGETETGVTIMQLDEGMDTGPILRTERLAISPSDTTATLSARLAELGAAALLRTLDDMAAGTVQPTPQDDDQATYAAMLDKSDGAVDWTRPARLVSAHIRAVDPWPVARSELGDETVKLFSPSVSAGASEPAVPGTILAIDGRGFEVACGEGAVAIGEVQAPGKRRMSAVEFARGRRLQVGARFGPS